MKTKIITAALILVALLSLAFVQTSKPVQWEYKLIGEDWRKVERLGLEGWELVAVEPVGGTSAANYYMKRQK